MQRLALFIYAITFCKDTNHCIGICKKAKRDAYLNWYEMNIGGGSY